MREICDICINIYSISCNELFFFPQTHDRHPVQASKRSSKNKPSKSNSFHHTSTSFTLQTSKWCIMEAVCVLDVQAFGCVRAHMKVSVNTKRADTQRCYVCEHICEHRYVFDHSGIFMISFRHVLRHRNTGIIICVFINTSFVTLTFYPSSTSKYRIYRQMMLIKTSQSWGLSFGRSFFFILNSSIHFLLCHFISAMMSVETGEPSSAAHLPEILLCQCCPNTEVSQRWHSGVLTSKSKLTN